MWNARSVATTARVRKGIDCRVADTGVGKNGVTSRKRAGRLDQGPLPWVAAPSHEGEPPPFGSRSRSVQVGLADAAGRTGVIFASSIAGLSVRSCSVATGRPSPPAPTPRGLCATCALTWSRSSKSTGRTPTRTLAGQERPDRRRGGGPPGAGRRCDRRLEAHHRHRRVNPPAPRRARQCRQSAQRRAVPAHPT
jgi:hypothetical protein